MMMIGVWLLQQILQRWALGHSPVARCTLARCCRDKHSVKDDDDVMRPVCCYAVVWTCKLHTGKFQWVVCTLALTDNDFIRIFWAVEFMCTLFALDLENSSTSTYWSFFSAENEVRVCVTLPTESNAHQIEVSCVPEWVHKNVTRMC